MERLKKTLKLRKKVLRKSAIPKEDVLIVLCLHGFHGFYLISNFTSSTERGNVRKGKVRYRVQVDTFFLDTSIFICHN